MLVILCAPGPQLSTLLSSALLCAREAEPSGFLLGPDNGSSQQGAGGWEPHTPGVAPSPQDCSSCRAALPPKFPPSWGLTQHFCTLDPSDLGW